MLKSEYIRIWKENHKDRVKEHSQRYHQKHRHSYLSIPTFGTSRKGGKHLIYTRGVIITPQAVRDIANRIMEDCIKNPRKYL